MLLMGNEETLAGFHVNSFVSALHEILDLEHRPQMSLLACRALTNMVEAIQNSPPSMVPLLPSLCGKLLTIEYIDLDEQTLELFAKLSSSIGRQMLRAGGLSAVLTFLDFFSISLQRSAVQTAANMCKHVTSDTFAIAVVITSTSAGSSTRSVKLSTSESDE